jgi:hypothetical protein
MLGLTPDELGDLEPRQFMNMLIGYQEQETERKLWAAYIQACNNPYLKEKPGTFKQFCDRMKGETKAIKMKPEQFLRIIGAK